MSDQEKTKATHITAGVFGIVLILVGVLLLFGNMVSFLSIEKLWPLFMMIPVVIFISLLLQDFKTNYGVIMPGTLLTFLTIYFIWLNFTSWDNVATTWPNFILAPAAGLFALYLANREKGLLIPVCILSAIAAVFYGMLLKSNMVAGIAFLAGGLILFISSFLRKK